MLLRVFLFVLPGAAMWALLPVVADDLLDAGSAGYGLLLGALGAGAVLGAAVLPRLGARLSANRLLLLSGVLFAVSLVACVFVPNLVVLAVLLVPAGMAWLFVLMGVTGALQVFLPEWVRARGLSMFNVVFAGSQAFGSLLWGLVAQAFGLVLTFVAAAVVMAAGAATVAIWPLPDVARLGPRPGRVLAGAGPGLRARPPGGPGAGHRALRGAAGGRGAVPGGDGAGAGSPGCAPARPAASSTATVPTRRCSCWSGLPDLGGAPAPAHRPADRHRPGARGAGQRLRGRGADGRPPLPGRTGRLGRRGHDDG